MDSEQPIIMITGEKTALGPLHRGILPLMAKWDNNLALSILSGDAARPRPPEASEREYEMYTKSGQGDWVLFVLYERATLRPIGITELTRINQMHRTAEFGIRIGESDCWGKGYGTEATILTLDYAFTAMGLHNVMLDVHSYNTRAISAYRRSGFQIIGRRRQAHRLGDRVFDQILMECLAIEFQRSFQPVLDLPSEDGLPGT